MRRLACIGSISLAVLLMGSVNAADWTGFRGSDGRARSVDRGVPTTWSDFENLKWKTALPGPGASSPIVVGSRVFVTSYSGYGLDQRDTGRMEDLQRHLVCLNRADGKIIWTKSIAAALPEDNYSGYISEHGYASSTPVSDGERVYVFYGKTGVLAYDLNGKELWRVKVGSLSSNRRWGSAASPVLYKNLLIVNAADEGRALLAFDRKTGKEVWKSEANGFELAYGTPALVDLGDGRQELALGVPGEVWGFNPDTGKLAWHASIPMGGNICPTLTSEAGIVYVTGGFPTGGCVAIRAGGKGDVTGSHILWSSRYTSYVPTPLVHQGRLYWVSDQGVAHCLNVATGELIYQERLNPGEGSGRPKLYASPILVGEHLYAVSRSHGVFVLNAKPQFVQVSQNRFAADSSVFNATPAASDGQLFLRSNGFLYCIAAGPK